MNYLLFVYPLVAAFIAWVWIDYYRLIDIYGKEDLKYILTTFFLGAASVGIVFAITFYIFHNETYQPSGNILTDFLFCVFRIGLIEEIAKALPFFIVLLLFKKHITEPIDYIAFICFSALGFSAVENTFYFIEYPDSIGGRSIVSTVGHMFDSSIIGYAMVVMKFKRKKFNIFILLGSILFAAISHGLYDFLIYHDLGIFSVIYFLFFISLFATFVNNALNNSSNFSYKTVLNNDNVDTRLLLYYFAILVVEFLLVGLHSGNFLKAYSHFSGELWTAGIISAITVVRLTRLKLIQGRWQPVKVELPFTIVITSAGTLTNSNSLGIKIKGEAYSENFMGAYYEDYFNLYPVSKTSYLEKKRLAYIEKKLFLKNDESFFLTKIFLDDTKEKFEYVLLKAKSKGKTLVDDKYRMVALLRIREMDYLTDTSKSAKDFGFIEWAYIKPLSPDLK